MLSVRLEFTPDLLALHATSPDSFPYLLMSAGTEGWDILFALPSQQQLFTEGEGAAFFEALSHLPLQADASCEGLPFVGGWFVYLGYELLTELEPTVPRALSDAFPLAVLTRIPAAVLQHRATGATWLVAESQHDLSELSARCRSTAAFTPMPVGVTSLQEDPPACYLDAIAQVKRYIQAGDVFQVNISRGWQAELLEDLPAAHLFAALRMANPAPFSAVAHLDDNTQIISSSPECLVRSYGGWTMTRPIAGTHPRSTDPLEDRLLKQHLIRSTKERAEHVMLVDLERNDLGRISLPGTVKVDELMAVISYPYVHHIESTIRGYLRPGVRPVDIVRALFPGGTITGCPKVRTMQIIRELETSARRAYTGSLGYINRNGTMQLNILIRTFMKQGKALRFRAGGGITMDSDPERELMETRHKARGLLSALGVPVD